MQQFIAAYNEYNNKYIFVADLFIFIFNIYI